MAAAEVLGLLAELERSLRSNPKEKITAEEEIVFRNLKGSLVDTFVFGGVVSSLITWRVSRRFSFAPRLLYSAGAAFLGGSWASKQVLRSSLDPIFVADGSRMQRELAKILLTKHHEEGLRRSFVSKYLYRLLYPEQVFVDLHPEKAFIRWRLRNSYEDDPGVETVENPPSEKRTHPARNLQRNLTRELKLEHQDMSDDPLGCILGYRGSPFEIHSGNDAGKTRVPSRASRRAHKRQRARERHLSKGIASDEI